MCRVQPGADSLRFDSTEIFLSFARAFTARRPGMRWQMSHNIEHGFLLAGVFWRKLDAQAFAPYYPPAVAGLTPCSKMCSVIGR